MKEINSIDVFCKHQVKTKMIGENNYECLIRIEKNLSPKCIYAFGDLVYEDKIICEKRIYLSRLKEPIKNRCRDFGVVNEETASSLIKYLSLKPS